MSSRKCFIFTALLVALVVLTAMPSWAGGTQKFALDRVNIKSLKKVVVVAASYSSSSDVSKDIDNMTAESADESIKGLSADILSTDSAWSTDKDALLAYFVARLQSVSPDMWSKVSADFPSFASSEEGNSGNTPADTNTPTEPDSAGTTPETPSSGPDSDDAFGDLDDGTQETQQAIDDAKEALDNAGVDMNALTPEERADLVENIKQETAAAQAEAASGAVSDPTVPAGTNLATSIDSGLSDLSATPKVTKPKELDATEQAQAVATLTEIEGIEAKDVVAATSENIEIGDVPRSLEQQINIITSLLENIADALTKIITGDTPNGVTVATTLPTLKPKYDGYYPMKVNLRHVPPTKKLQLWRSTKDIKDAAGVASVSVSAAKDYYFLDENGKVTEKVQGNAANMTVVPYLEAGETYDSAFITVEATADDQKALETYAAAEPENPETSSSGGGCNLGFAALGLIAAATLLLKKKF